MGGSPSKLQKQTLKIVEKEKRLQYNDPHFLESNIVYGWFVDCCCGLKGVNVDDGHRMVECDVCKVWMHCICNNIPTQTKQELFKYFSKMESHFQRGKALPNPPSWILLLLLTILMSDLSTVCNKIVNSFNK